MNFLGAMETLGDLGKQVPKPKKTRRQRMTRKATASCKPTVVDGILQCPPGCQQLPPDQYCPAALCCEPTGDTGGGTATTDDAAIAKCLNALSVDRKIKQSYKAYGDAVGKLRRLRDLYENSPKATSAFGGPVRGTFTQVQWRDSVLNTLADISTSLMKTEKEMWDKMRACTGEKYWWAGSGWFTPEENLKKFSGWAQALVGSVHAPFKDVGVIFGTNNDTWNDLHSLLWGGDMRAMPMDDPVKLPGYMYVLAIILRDAFNEFGRALFGPGNKAMAKLGKALMGGHYGTNISGKIGMLPFKDAPVHFYYDQVGYADFGFSDEEIDQLTGRRKLYGLGADLDSGTRNLLIGAAVIGGLWWFLGRNK